MPSLRVGGVEAGFRGTTVARRAARKGATPICAGRPELRTRS